MGVSIPIGGSGAGSVRIPIGIGARNTAPTDRESALLRAVAGGASLRDPQQARRTAKTAKDDPGAVPPVQQADTDRLRPVLARIDRAMNNRAGAAPPGQQEIAVARAIGADPILVKAAFDALPAAAEIGSALVWVAGTEPRLLEVGGQAATRQAGLAALPAPSARLDQAEADLVALRAQIAAIPAAAVGPQGIPGPPGVQGPPADLAPLLPAVQQLLQPLLDRIAALEAKVP